MKNGCMLQAVLKASAQLGRPLSPTVVSRLVHVIERNEGWPLGRMIELFHLLMDELAIIALVQMRGKTLTSVAPGMPMIVLYDTGRKAHAEFGYAPMECPRDVYGLFILAPKGVRAKPKGNEEAQDDRQRTD